MKIIEAFILVLLLATLGFGLYVFWLNIPWEPIRYQDFKANITQNLSENSIQFYPNLRYPDRIINYSISSDCNSKRKGDAEEAFNILAGKTVLEFIKVPQDGEIQVYCSNLQTEPNAKYYIAGEGGPTEIINSTDYYVILSGRVSLYRADTCTQPQIAIHEILHALGFDHNNNSESIMYPETSCQEQIDKYIVDEINKLYSIPGLPDLTIENVSASKVGRFLNFDIVISNIGLKNAKNSSLSIYADSSFVDEIPIAQLDIGTKRMLSVQNLRVPRTFNEIRFVVNYDGSEILKTNNEVGISVE